MSAYVSRSSMAATNSTAKSTYVARKLTPVATEGPVGAAYAVMERPWTCPDCNHNNGPKRPRCYQCRARKPADGGGTLEHDAMQGKSPWREAMDPASNLLYYFNTESNKVTWDRPEEMGPAPTGTGWYGRGKAGGLEKYARLNKEYLKRPARKQQEFISAKAYQRPEGANEYNIWYGRYMGEHWRNERGNEPAEFKCDVARDSGWTKADKMPGLSYFCIHYARGSCARGKECTFYHHVPTGADKKGQTTTMRDIFGRERHQDHRDDMGGVGSFKDDCRTLYVGGLKQKSQYNVQKAVEDAFEAFGEVENINIIYRLSIAFVRYRVRSSAEMAKEAMANQALGNKEVLNLRWAYDDPNPVAKTAGQRADHDAVLAHMRAQGVSDQSAGFVYPDGYDLPAPKRQRLEKDGYGNVVPDGDGSQIYPDTDTQFALAVQQQQQLVQAQAARIGPARALVQVAPPVVAAPVTQEQAAQEAEVRRVQTNQSALDAILNGIDAQKKQ